MEPAAAMRLKRRFHLSAVLFLNLNPILLAENPDLFNPNDGGN